MTPYGDIYLVNVDISLVRFPGALPRPIPQEVLKISIHKMRLKKIHL